MNVWCECCEIFIVLVLRCKINRSFFFSNFNLSSFNPNWVGIMVKRKENSSEQWNFAFCFRPIYYFARVCGQMPFTITCPENGTMVGAKMFKRDFIWLAMSLCIQIAFIHMAVQLFKSNQRANLVTYTIYFGNLTVWFISLLLGICTMVLGAQNRLKIVGILNEFTIFDQEVFEATNYFLGNCILISIHMSSYVCKSSPVIMEFISTIKWEIDTLGFIVPQSYSLAWFYPQQHFTADSNTIWTAIRWWT